MPSGDRTQATLLISGVGREGSPDALRLLCGRGPGLQRYGDAWGRKTETERHRRDRAAERDGDFQRRETEAEKRRESEGETDAETKSHTDPERPTDPQRCGAEGAAVPPAPRARRVAPKSRALCPPPSRLPRLQPGEALSRSLRCDSPTGRPPFSGRPWAPG